MNLPSLAAQWLGAWLAGLAASAHCFGMCGGLQAALAPGAGGGGLWRLQLGRTLAYVSLGALAGGFGGGLGAAASIGLQTAPGTATAVAGLPVATVLRWVAVLLATLALAGLAWRLLDRRDLFGLERLGVTLWQSLQPLGRRAGNWREPWRSLGLGFIWAFIPCALVLSMAALAATTGSAAQGAALMGAFALGTWPALLGAAALGRSLSTVRAGTPVWLRALVVVGLLLLAGAQWSFLLAPHHHAPATTPADAAQSPDAPAGDAHPHHHQPTTG